MRADGDSTASWWKYLEQLYDVGTTYEKTLAFVEKKINKILLRLSYVVESIRRLNR